MGVFYLLYVVLLFISPLFCACKTPPGWSDTLIPASANARLCFSFALKQPYSLYKALEKELYARADPESDDYGEWMSLVELCDFLDEQRLKLEYKQLKHQDLPKLQKLLDGRDKTDGWNTLWEAEKYLLEYFLTELPSLDMRPWPQLVTGDGSIDADAEDDELLGVTHFGPIAYRARCNDVVRLCLSVADAERLFKTRFTVYKHHKKSLEAALSDDEGMSSVLSKELTAIRPSTQAPQVQIPAEIYKLVDFIGGIDSPIHTYHLRRPKHVHSPRHSQLAKHHLSERKLLEANDASSASSELEAAGHSYSSTYCDTSSSSASSLYTSSLFRHFHHESAAAMFDWLLTGDGEIGVWFRVRCKDGRFSEHFQIPCADPSLFNNNNNPIVNKNNTWPSITHSQNDDLVSAFEIMIVDEFGRERIETFRPEKICVHDFQKKTEDRYHNVGSHTSSLCHVAIAIPNYSRVSLRVRTVFGDNSYGLSCLSHSLMAQPYATIPFLRSLYRLPSTFPRGAAASSASESASKHSNLQKNSHVVVEFLEQWYSPHDVDEFLQLNGVVHEDNIEDSAWENQNEHDALYADADKQKLRQMKEQEKEEERIWNSRYDNHSPYSPYHQLKEKPSGHHSHTDESDSESISQSHSHNHNRHLLQTHAPFPGEARLPHARVRLFGLNNVKLGATKGEESQLDIQVLMGINPFTPAHFWYVSGREKRFGVPGGPIEEEPFLRWLFDLGNLHSPPLVQSISYGDIEKNLDEHYMRRVDYEFVKAGLRGVTLVFASGDTGLNSEFPIPTPTDREKRKEMEKEHELRQEERRLQAEHDSNNAKRARDAVGSSYEESRRHNHNRRTLELAEETPRVVANDMKSSESSSEPPVESYPSFPCTSAFVTCVGATQMSADIAPMCHSSFHGLSLGGGGFTSGPSSGCAALAQEVACSAAENTDGIITSGGGFSHVFARPWYQQKAVRNWLNTAHRRHVLPPFSFFNPYGRAYPDISAYGTRYPVLMNGTLVPMAGTSASTPLIAAVISLLNEYRLSHGLPVVGFINPLLYAIASLPHSSASLSSAFFDIIYGDNACAERGDPCSEWGFSALPGYDPVSGLGTPNFPELVRYALDFGLAARERKEAKRKAQRKGKTKSDANSHQVKVEDSNGIVDTNDFGLNNKQVEKQHGKAAAHSHSHHHNKDIEDYSDSELFIDADSVNNIGNAESQLSSESSTQTDPASSAQTRAGGWSFGVLFIVLALVFSAFGIYCLKLRPMLGMKDTWSSTLPLRPSRADYETLLSSTADEE